MNLSAHATQDPHGIFDVVGRIRRKGVKLWSENGRLRYLGPKGALTQDEMHKLNTSRQKVIAFLERGAGVQLPRLDTVRTVQAEDRRIALAHSQLAHWNLYNLIARPSFNVLSWEV